MILFIVLLWPFLSLKCCLKVKISPLGPQRKLWNNRRVSTVTITILGMKYHFNDLKTHYSSPHPVPSLFLYHCLSTAPPISHPSLYFFHFGGVVYSDEVVWMNECGVL